MVYTKLVKGGFVGYNVGFTRAGTSPNFFLGGQQCTWHEMGAH